MWIKGTAFLHRKLAYGKQVVLCELHIVNGIRIQALAWAQPHCLTAGLSCLQNLIFEILNYFLKLVRSAHLEGQVLKTLLQLL